MRLFYLWLSYFSPYGGHPHLERNACPGGWFIENHPEGLAL